MSKQRNILPKAHETDVVAGQWYLVAHVWLITQDGGGAWVPVFPIQHRDKDFDEVAKSLHYHVDARFSTKAKITLHDRQDGIRTNTILSIGKTFKTPFSYYYVSEDHKIVYRRKKARCSDTGIIPMLGGKLAPMYIAFEKRYLGKKAKCAGTVCPHFGARLIQREDGSSYCPMHDLQFNEHGVCVPHKLPSHEPSHS